MSLNPKALEAISDLWVKTITEVAELIVDSTWQQLAADGDDINHPDISDDERDAYKMGIEVGIQAGISATLATLARHNAVDGTILAAGPQ